MTGDPSRCSSDRIGAVERGLFECRPSSLRAVVGPRSGFPAVDGDGRPPPSGSIDAAAERLRGRRWRQHDDRAGDRTDGSSQRQAHSVDGPGRRHGGVGVARGLRVSRPSTTLASSSTSWARSGSTTSTTSTPASGNVRWPMVGLLDRPCSQAIASSRLPVGKTRTG